MSTANKRKTIKSNESLLCEFEYLINHELAPYISQCKKEQKLYGVTDTLISQFGAIVKAVRLFKGLNQMDVSKKGNIPLIDISRIELGDTNFIFVENRISSLAKGLGVKLFILESVFLRLGFPSMKMRDRGNLNTRKFRKYDDEERDSLVADFGYVFTNEE